MPKVSIGEVDLWYEFNGAGETVIQVGGAVSAHEGYATITPRLSEHYRVLDYDHRGYGLSNRPEQQYTLSTWSDDLVALMDALGLEKAHIHGGSMGSFIAINFAAMYSERVEKLLLGAGAVARCDEMAKLHFRVWQDVASAYGVASEELARELLTKAFSRAYLDSISEDALLADMRDVTARNVETDVFIDACQAMIDTDVTTSLDQVTAPTLVMVGSEDILTPLDMGPEGAGARYVAEHLAQAELAIFEGSGHGHYIERPEDSIDTILRFLQA
ncbi:MAG: alpha/beta fold hydrolase [Acidobacteria bacterium]|nr:alpha/beta fold hydrolase [Acidobacteriota bacterium]MCH8898895.1 alpha/beta fold hydrolase [Acidobacteriota bacterium]